MIIEAFESMDWEIAHHYDSDGGDYIFSKSNQFEIFIDGHTYRFSIPLKLIFAVPNALRISRRLMRLDKSSAVFNLKRDGVVVIYRGQIWFYDIKTECVQNVGKLRQSRNALHCAVSVNEHGIYFGEYGQNPERKSVPVWRSVDDGRSWAIVYEFPAGFTKHIHGVYFDTFTDRFWIPTGDDDGECNLTSANADFTDLIVHGDGTQRWRPVSMFFKADKIVWAMDSPLAPSMLQIFDRATGDLSQHTRFPGPVWYSKTLSDGYYLLQSSVEPGPSVESSYAHVYCSRDLETWDEICKFKKDSWTMRFFKFGVVAFADGKQTSQDFVMHGEALRGFDGKVGKFKLLQKQLEE